MPLLNNGDAFPKLTLKAVGGGEIALPAALAGSWGVVIIYRGAWCPFCNGQLASYAAEKAALDDLGVKVIALSVDDEATSAATVAKNHLQFPGRPQRRRGRGLGRDRSLRQCEPALFAAGEFRSRSRWNGEGGGLRHQRHWADDGQGGGRLRRLSEVGGRQGRRGRVTGRATPLPSAPVASAPDLACGGAPDGAD